MDALALVYAVSPAAAEGWDIVTIGSLLARLRSLGRVP
jgi:hypothetical protein